MAKQGGRETRPERGSGRYPRTELVPCALCGSSDSRVVATKFGLNLVRCKDCGLVFANPRLPQAEVEKRYEDPAFFSEYLEAHRATASGCDRAFLRDHYGLYLKMIHPLLSAGKRLLDVGCGAGFFLRVARDEGWEAEGVEISRRLAGYAAEIVGVEVRLGSLESRRFPPETFDVITLLDVLEHVPDPRRTLEEIVRILKPGGVVLISTPDYHSLSRVFLGSPWAVLSPAEHLSLFTSRTLRALLERAGLSILGGMRNILVFNPDYTHRKGFRSSLWKAVYTRLARGRAAARVHSYESGETMSLEPRPRPAGRTPGAVRAARNRVYKLARRWLRGDIIVALAQKKS